MVLILAGLVFSAVATAATPARLGLWVTDSIGATSGIQCNVEESLASTQSLLATQPTLTERDVSAWDAASAQWALSIDRFSSLDEMRKLEDRCFVLAIDGKFVTSGVILSSYSARMIRFSTLSVIRKDKALKLQLRSGNHARSDLIHVRTLDAVLGLKLDQEAPRGERAAEM